MEVAVDVVLDGGDVELGEDLGEFFLVLVGHAGAEGIGVAGHDQKGLYRVVGEGVAGGVEADAGAGAGGDFDDLEVEGLEGFEKTEVGGGFDGDGVAGFGDGAEGEVEGFGAADGDDEFVVGKGAAGLEVAAGDLAGEGVVGPVHRVAAEEGGVVAADGGKGAGEFLGGEEGGVGAGGAEGDVGGVRGEGEDLGGEVVDADVAGLGHGLGHARLGRGAGQAGADVVAGLGAGFDEAAVFEEGVGLEDGGDADVALEGHAADGGEPVAGAQGALVDEMLEGAREFDVERRGGGERLDHGDGGGATDREHRAKRRDGAGVAAQN